jgi:hypothetical protein
MGTRERVKYGTVGDAVTAGMSSTPTVVQGSTPAPARGATSQRTLGRLQTDTPSDDRAGEVADDGRGRHARR